MVIECQDSVLCSLRCEFGFAFGDFVSDVDIFWLSVNNSAFPGNLAVWGCCTARAIPFGVLGFHFKLSIPEVFFRSSCISVLFKWLLKSSFSSMRFFFSLKEIPLNSWLAVFTQSMMRWNYLSFSLLIIERFIHVQKNLLESSRWIMAASFWRVWTLKFVPPGIL